MKLYIYIIYTNVKSVCLCVATVLQKIKTKNGLKIFVICPFYTEDEECLGKKLYYRKTKYIYIYIYIYVYIQFILLFEKIYLIFL